MTGRWTKHDQQAAAIRNWLEHNPAALERAYRHVVARIDIGDAAVDRAALRRCGAAARSCMVLASLPGGRRSSWTSPRMHAPLSSQKTHLYRLPALRCGVMASSASRAGRSSPGWLAMQPAGHKQRIGWWP